MEVVRGTPGLKNNTIRKPYQETENHQTLKTKDAHGRINNGVESNSIQQYSRVLCSQLTNLHAQIRADVVVVVVVARQKRRENV